MARPKTSAKMSPKKRIALITSLVLVAALLLGGAYAWIDFSQSFVNRFRGGVTPDILLHDDFEPWVNKDVYVENPGEQDMYVRVQFKEFLQIGNNILVGGNPDAKETWEVHTFHDPDWVQFGPDGAVDPDYIGCELESHDYFTWYMTGDKKTYLHGTSEQGNENYDAMITDIMAIHGVTSLTGGIDDPKVIGPNGQMFGETQEGALVTIDEWLLDPSKETFVGWILDDDGWCYWSQPLKSGEATSLLLDNVKKNPDNLPDDNFAYFIDVALQASNKTELRKFLETDDISLDARNIWEIPDVTAVDVSLAKTPFVALLGTPAAATMSNASGSTLSLFAQVDGVNNPPQSVYWTIMDAPAPPAGVTIDQTGKITLTAAVADGAKFQVKVFSLFDQTISRIIEVTAEAPGP